jgi:predicted membrane protein
MLIINIMLNGAQDGRWFNRMYKKIIFYIEQFFDFSEDWLENQLSKLHPLFAYLVLWSICNLLVYSIGLYLCLRFWTQKSLN